MAALSELDYHSLVVEFNATDDVGFLGKRLDRLFEAIAKEYASNIALIHGDTKTSYQDLNTSANKMSRYLSQRGVTRGDLIGLAVERSIDLIVVMLAVLKLGAAYVPIDSAFPKDRIDQMVEDADPKLIITSGDPTEGLSRWTNLCLRVDQISLGSINDTSNLETDILPKDLAYVIYTSGSTGRPKGVEISHGASSNFLTSLRLREPGCGPHDRLLAITTISFDMSILELLLPILSGATMIIAHKNAVQNPDELLRLMRGHDITIMQATPATWSMLCESGWQGEPRLSKAICGGEVFSRQLADRLLAYTDTVWNVYGPSETTYGSVGRISNDGPIFVGNPVANGRIYILGKDMLPVPIGSSGEVYIGGGSVSNGYRNKPELTRSRFLPNPFHGGTFFRTGDLARFLAPGKIQVQGRIDGMVKVRGFRVEVGDIEAAILDHGTVSEAVVIVRGDRLIAYCVPSANPLASISSDGADGSSFNDALRAWLTERLPAYMVPAFIVPMDALPLSPNQKVDRKALPDPIKKLRIMPNMQPTTDMELKVRDIWSEVLGHDRLGIEDSFFNVGGDSVRLIRAQVKIEKMICRKIPVPKLFEHFTIKALAAYLVGLADNNVVVKDKDSDREREAVNGIHGNASRLEDVAIVSMACHLPGGIYSPDDFWNLLKNGVDAISEVPKDRWDAEALFDADPDASGKSYCRYGGFLDSISVYDLPFFGISPREAREMDSAQLLALQVGWEAFERAGYTKEMLYGSDTGVYLGASNNVATNQSSADLNGYSITGSASAVLSGRLSYFLGLNGPSMTVDAACSSSLVTTHLACNALRLGECDMALAGGVSILSTPGIHVEFSRLRGLSPDGRCRAFSDDTEGTGFSEGCSMVVLKRLSDARRDGDIIHGVIRGTGVSHGGRAASLTAPSGPSQARLIRRVLRSAGVQAGDIDYIEAHGTATKLGDPIEAAALADVFGGSHSETQPLWVGSSKSNIGHCGAAAGITGLLKVVLSMENRILPRTLHVREPTPSVDWKGTGMSLVQDEQPWPVIEGHKRLAGTSSYGIGGTGAHIIIEEFSETEQTDRPNLAFQLSSELVFLLSGKTRSALRHQASTLEQFIRDSEPAVSILNTAFSLATTRTHFQHRWAVKAQDKEELLSQLASLSQPGSLLAGSPSDSTDEEPHLALLFSGQGSQVLGMGRMLYQIYPQFRTALDEAAAYFSQLEEPLLDVMWADTGSSKATLLHRTDFAQAALFSVQVALWNLYQAFGIRPDVVLGHSIGEFAAAYAAGILDLPSACRLVATRGRLMAAMPTGGGMIVLETSLAEATAAISSLNLGTKVSIAACNTPEQTVISGQEAETNQLAELFTLRGSKCKRLKVSHAFHSHFMQGMLPDFRAVAEKIAFHPPQLAIVSGRTGKLAEIGQLEDPEYWVQHIVDTVRYSDAIQAVADLGANVFLELGPKPVLCGMGMECLANLDNGRLDYVKAWLPSLKPGKRDFSVVLNSLSELHIRHVAVDWSAAFLPLHGRRIELPTYAFERTHDTLHHGSGGIGSLVRGSLSSNASAKRIDQHRFDIEWCPLDAAAGRALLGMTWGIYYPAGSDASWMSEAATTLSRAGLHVRRVDQLRDAEALGGLICLWDSAADVAADVLDQTHSLSGAALCQLQAAATMGFLPTLVWITRQAVGIAVHKDDSPVNINIETAPLWGLARTARTEHPDLRLRLVDLDVGQDTVDALPQALNLEDEPECALRNGKVLVPRIQQAQPPKSSSFTAQRRYVRSDGAVLITGGLGDIGQQFSRRLVKSHGVTDLVLACRRGVNTPGAAALVGELAKLGAKVTVLPVDMGERASVKAMLAFFQPNRPLRGIVHTAGVLDDGVLTSLTMPRLKTVYRAKVDGAWYLHDLTRSMDLDFFIMCSSLSGIIGNAGQANYAAANTFLDALAYMRSTMGLPATAVSLGLWGGEGMRARLSEAAQARYAEMGMGAIEPETGLDLFEQLVRDDCPHAIAAVYDLGKLQAHYKESGCIPALFRSLVPDSPSRPAHAAVHGALDLRTILSEVGDRKQHEDIVLDAVQHELARVLGFGSKDSVDVDKPLQDVGVDSLTAIVTRNRLASMTGLTLSTKIVYEHPHLKSLSRFLLSEMQAGTVLSSSDTSSGSTAATTISEAAAGDLSTVNEGCLDPQLVFKTSRDVPDYPSKVFMTGATGYCGAFITGLLLKMGVRVHCLVRAASTDAGRQRLIQALDEYNLWTSEYESLLATVCGDISLPLLGMARASFEKLADEVDAICHAAALVDWMRPLKDYVGPNVTSTQEILRLASTGRTKPVHYISTIAVLPRYMGYNVLETETEYGYSTSKWMAEQMVSSARWRGAKASIYRLPYVTAASTGHFRLDRGDFLHNMIAGSVDMGSFPSIDTDLSLVLPVDYLAQSVVAVMTQHLSRIGQDINFVNNNALSFDQYFKLLAGTQHELIPYCEWRRQALEFATVHPKSSLARIAAVLDSCPTEKDAINMFSFSGIETGHLACPEFPAPSIDERMAQAYLGQISSYESGASFSKS